MVEFICAEPGFLTMESRSYRLLAVDRALNLLKILAYSPTTLTIMQLSRKLGIPKSTTHYLVRTLVARGYVRREGDNRHYSLGRRLADLPNASRPSRHHCPRGLCETLAGSSTGLTLIQLSRELGIPKSTTHYLVKTLVARGYVWRTGDARHYSLGPAYTDLHRILRVSSF